MNPSSLIKPLYAPTHLLFTPLLSNRTSYLRLLPSPMSSVTPSLPHLIRQTTTYVHCALRVFTSIGAKIPGNSHITFRYVAFLTILITPRYQTFICDGPNEHHINLGIILFIAPSPSSGPLEQFVMSG